MATAIIIPPKITKEENEKRIKELERVLSKIFKCEITVTFRDSSKSIKATKRRKTPDFSNEH